MLNVVPIKDEKEHQHDSDCWCKPEVIWHDERDGKVYEKGPIVVHNSADCREQVERLIGDHCGGWAVFED